MLVGLSPLNPFVPSRRPVEMGRFVPRLEARGGPPCIDKFLVAGHSHSVGVGKCRADRIVLAAAP